MKEDIKQLRKNIDGLAQLTKSLKTIKENIRIGKNRGGQTVPIWKSLNSKEIEKAVDSLYLSKCWLGKILGELNEPTPYKNDGNRKTIKDIEPTADVNKEIPFGDKEGDLWRDKNHIEKVDWLRGEIEKLSNTIMDLKSNTHTISYIASIATTSCFNYLCEARFWLGFELERIRNENKSDETIKPVENEHGDSVAKFCNYKVKFKNLQREGDNYIIVFQGERKIVDISYICFATPHPITKAEVLDKFKGTKGDIEYIEGLIKK